MRLQRLRFAASVLLVPSLFGGDPLLFIGKETPVFITASATVRRDDNIGLSPTIKQSDTIFVLTPGFELAMDGAERRASLSVSEQFIRYDSDSRLDSELLTALGAFDYLGARSRLGVRASYQEMDQTNLSLTSSEQSIRRNMTSASGNGSWMATAKSSVGGGFSFERTDYPAIGYVDSDVWSFPVDYYFAYSPKLDLSAGYRYRRTSMERGFGSSKDNFYNVGARGAFTSKLSGQVRIGYSTRDEDRGNDNSVLGLGASLGYEYSPKATFAFNLSNDFNSSAFGSSQEVFAVGLGGSFDLDLQWKLSTNFSFSSSKYLDGTGRKDDFFVGDVAATYLISSKSSVHLSYVFRKNSSTADVVSFENNVISLSSGVRF
jgi:polysaccharide biosynthesis protein VpsM